MAALRRLLGLVNLEELSDASERHTESAHRTVDAAEKSGQRSRQARRRILDIVSGDDAIRRMSGVVELRDRQRGQD